MFRNDGSIHQQRLLDFLVQSTLISRHQSIWMVNGFHDNLDMFTAKKEHILILVVAGDFSHHLAKARIVWSIRALGMKSTPWVPSKLIHNGRSIVASFHTNEWHSDPLLPRFGNPPPPKKNHGIIRLDSYIPMSTNKILGPVSVLPCQDSQWKWWPSLAYSHRSHHPGSRTYFDYSSLL